MQRFQPIMAFLAMFFLAASSPMLAPPGAAAAAETGAAAAPNGGKTTIAAFGDSLVAGYGVGPGDSFPEQLQKALRAKGYDVDVLNAGESGGTTTGGLARLTWSVPANADLVIVELGANDALRGIAPKITEANLEAILAKLKARGQKVILAGMIAPPNMGPDYSSRFNPIYARLAKKEDVPLYPFFLDGVAAKPDLNQADAMHPNAKGVAVIVEKMLPTITKALDGLKATSG